MAAAGCGAGREAGESALPVRKQVGLSPILHLDRIYRSMQGPSAETSFRLGGDGPREILWITAYRTEVVNAAGESDPKLSEFMCHNNLDFGSALHRDLFGLQRQIAFGRMFTASQGVFEADLPEGYGIPLLSDEPLTVSTMVLNHNHPQIDLDVRHRITIEYVRDADAKGRLLPLYPAFAPVMALVEGHDGLYGVEGEAEEHMEGAACAPGLVAPNAPEGTKFYHDPQGRVFTQHWVVPPGPEDRHTLVTEVLNLPFDTTLHYINAHMHPWAKSLELRDLSTGETLFRAGAKPPAQGVGLARVDAFASAQGIPVYRDHQYEMRSLYDNPTGAEQDAMAIFFVYYRDKEMESRLDAVRKQLVEQHAAAPAPASGAGG
jgi:hypothetical protein